MTKTLVTPTPAVSTGAVVAGKYRVIEELGRGGMGIVYKAEDTRLKRTVALKFLPPELVHTPEIKDRFMRDARKSTRGRSSPACWWSMHCPRHAASEPGPTSGPGTRS